VPFTLGDRLGGQVDVGSGNLMITMSLFTLPRRAASPLEVGLAYNSVTRRAEAQFGGSVGRFSSGWRLSTGSDVRLEPVAGHGAVVYRGPNGLTGAFLPDGSGGFTSPAGFTMTLTAVSGGGWPLNDHGSGDTRHFDAAGRLTRLTDRAGNDSTFSYDTSGALTEITADVGGTGARTLTVATEGPGRGRITEISRTADGYDATTRSVALAYDGNGDLHR
jgi:YD repeat-containing protein